MPTAQLNRRRRNRLPRDACSQRLAALPGHLRGALAPACASWMRSRACEAAAQVHTRFIAGWCARCRGRCSRAKCPFAASRRRFDQHYPRPISIWPGRVVPIVSGCRRRPSTVTRRYPDAVGSVTVRARAVDSYAAATDSFFGNTLRSAALTSPRWCRRLAQGSGRTGTRLRPGWLHSPLDHSTPCLNENSSVHHAAGCPWARACRRPKPRSSILADTRRPAFFPI